MICKDCGEYSGDGFCEFCMKPIKGVSFGKTLLISVLLIILGVMLFIGLNSCKKAEKCYTCTLFPETPRKDNICGEQNVSTYLHNAEIYKYTKATCQ